MVPLFGLLLRRESTMNLKWNEGKNSKLHMASKIRLIHELENKISLLKVTKAIYSAWESVKTTHKDRNVDQ